MDLAFLRALVEASSKNLDKFCIIKRKGIVHLYSDHLCTYESLNLIPENKFVTGYTPYEGKSSWNEWGNEKVFQDDGLNKSTSLPTTDLDDEWKSTLSEIEYTDLVEKMRSDMECGKYYLANLTRKISKNATIDSIFLAVTSCLYHECDDRFFLFDRDNSILGLSPEKFISIEDGVACAQPMKGTGSDIYELEQNIKELEENIMMTDLVRSDLSQICQPDTLKVVEQNKFSTHPGIVQMSSVIAGTLNSDLKVTDAIAKTLPVSSVTGTPKPYVVNIIKEYEPTSRGIYCGVYGFIDTKNQTCDLNVSIRTIEVEKNKVSIGVGAGITFLSDPTKEWHETELKASRLKDLVELQREDKHETVFTSLALNSEFQLFSPHLHLKRIIEHANNALSVSLNKKELELQLYLFCKELDFKVDHYIRITVNEQSETSFEYLPYNSNAEPITLGIGFHSHNTDSLLIKSGNRNSYNTALQMATVLTTNSIDDALLFVDGTFTETTRANIFVRKGSTIFTPPSTPQSLTGILRTRLIHRIQTKNEFTIEEKSLSLDDLRSSDEMIITNSVRGPQQVKSISCDLIESDIEFKKEECLLLDFATTVFESEFVQLQIT